MKLMVQERGCRILYGAIVLLGFFAFPPQSQAQYAADISRWTAQDALDRPVADAILFTGSSSIRRWEQLTRDFADYKVIQRGFGGSHFDHLSTYVNDIVLPYNPRAIVIWAGTNDVASGNSGEEVSEDYRRFVSLVHAAQPNVDIFYLGITPTPGRRANKQQEDVANAGIVGQAAGNPKLHYIDLPAAYATLNPYADKAFTSKFVDDIHLNRAGYEFWTTTIRPQVEAVIAPNKVFALNPKTPQPGGKIFFDFGPSNGVDGQQTLRPDANGNHWNNWHAANGGSTINAGEHIGNLVDAKGTATGIRLTITAGFQVNGKRNGGLAAPDSNLLGDLAVASATVDYFFSTADGVQGGGSDDSGGGFMLDGLDPGLSYNFRLFGSRSRAETCRTAYRLTGANDQTVELQTSGSSIGQDRSYNGNDDEVVSVRGVRPDQFGQVFFDQTLLEGSFAYLNAMEVTVHLAPKPASAALGSNER